MNTAMAYTKALSQGGFLFGIPMAHAVAALGAIQVGLIASQKPPVMAEGGLIGGKPHSQGGTMINAERGEFVMRRSAVDSIGVETLNRLKAQGVNISTPKLRYFVTVNHDMRKHRFGQYEAEFGVQGQRSAGETINLGVKHLMSVIYTSLEIVDKIVEELKIANLKLFIKNFKIVRVLL